MVKDMTKNKKCFAIFTVLALVSISLMVPFLSDDSSAAAESPMALFDMGNGDVEWVDIGDMSGTMKNVSTAAANKAGLTFSDSPSISIGGKTSTTIEVGDNFIFHTWAQYYWDDSAGDWVLIEDLTHSLNKLKVDDIKYVLLSYYKSFENGVDLSPPPLNSVTLPAEEADTVHFYIQYNGFGTGTDEWVKGTADATGTVYSALRAVGTRYVSIYYDINSILKIKWMYTVLGDGSRVNGLLDNRSWSRFVPTDIITDGSSIADNSSETNPLSSADIETHWEFFIWNETTSKWVLTTYDPAATYNGETIAWGFLPDTIVPSADPINKYPWTMIRKDSASSASTVSELSSEQRNTVWYRSFGNGNFVNPTILSAGDKIFVVSGGNNSTSSEVIDPALYCFNRFTGAELWKFSYPTSAGYEVSTPLVVGNSIFVSATNGGIYKLDIDTGHLQVYAAVPNSLENILNRKPTGPTSMVFDSGVIYVGSSNGVIFACDIDLNVIWQFATNGWLYYSAPTISGDTLFMGSYDGCVYALDKRTGALKAKELVFERSPGNGGLANSVVIVDDVLFIPYSDGMGMDTQVGGVAGYTFDGTTFTKLWDTDDMGPVSNYCLPVEDGAIFSSLDGLFHVDRDGKLTLLNKKLGTLKAPPTLVNGDMLYVVQYDAGGSVFLMDLNGKVIKSIKISPYSSTSYSMNPAIIIDGWLYVGNDYGAVYAIQGMVGSAGGGDDPGAGYLWWVLFAIILIVLAVIYYMIKTGRIVLPESKLSHVKRGKRRLVYLLLIGTVLIFVLFLISLSVGPSATLSLGETFRSLTSAIQKGGEGLTFNELIVYDSRLPRVMAAFAVGVGLAVAGAMYQAIIRNPLVDPYIMGVSSGAGAAAIAVIAFNFTFFGLFSSDFTFALPIAAIIGGLAAFFSTMMIAERAGKSSVNYVLAGVVVGLAFGAVQTLLFYQSGDKVHDAMTWMFGSFANISWNEVWLVFIPALCLSLIPLLWAKEFNLVLLGEDQAKQMGLNVVKFNRLMLILASVLTAVCVAFVGIIGFVGLVVPHVCRMLLGGDHRLVLPASILVGGFMMMLADLLAKMLMMPQELPVGAITTVIGVPIFAYLLIKRGRMYDG